MEVERGKDSVLYCIDGSRSMAGANWLGLALAAVADSVRASTLAQPDQDSGVIVYNLSGDASYRVVMPLKPPSTTSIKNLMRLAEDEEFRKSELASADASVDALPQCLETAIDQFDAVTKNSFRRLVLVTNSDEPVLGSGRTAALTRFEDLAGRDVRIVPVFLEATKGAFDVRKFWDSVRTLGPAIVDAANLESTGLVPIVEAKARRQHTTFRAVLVVHDTNLKMSVSGHALYTAQSLPTPRKIFVNEDKEQLLTSTTVYADTETGSLVKPDELRLAFTWGDHKPDQSDRDAIPATPELLKELRQFEPEPTIRVLAFRQGLQRPLRGFRGHSMFVRPQNQPLAGSIAAFASLRRSMLRKNVTALVSAAVRQSDTPRLGYLYAETESLQGSGGLQLVLLPYVEELRDLPEGEFRDVAAGSELVEAMTDVVSKLHHSPYFDASKFGDRRLEYFRQLIEATALSLPAPVLNEDPTLPKFDDDVASDAYAHLETLLARASAQLDDDAHAQAALKSKPKREVRPKPQGTSLDQVEQHLANAVLGTSPMPESVVEEYAKLLKDYTVPELRQVMENTKHDFGPKKSKKDDLVLVLATWFASSVPLQAAKRAKTE